MRPFWKRESAPSQHLDQQLVAKTHSRRLPSWRQLKYFLTILSDRERMWLQGTAFFFLAMAIVVGVRSYLRLTEVVPEAGGTYAEAMVGSPQHLNPLYAIANDVDADLARLIYSGLFRYDEHQQLVNDLILDYGLTEDQKTYTFYLRQDVKWHDGESLTADDVVFTMQAIQDPAYGSPLRQSLQGAQIQKLTDYSFNITLTEPFAPFPTALTFGMMPRHLWYDIPPQTANLAQYNLERPIGTGPYKVYQYSKNKSGYFLSYRLRMHDDYYGRRPYIRDLMIRFYPDFPSAVDAVKNKNVDGISFLPRESKEELSRVKHLSHHPMRLPQYTAVFFNQKNSLLKDQNVRQALMWAIDRTAIVRDVLGGDGQVINTPILPGVLGHNPELATYGYDVEKAKKILDDAKWALLEGQSVRKKGEQELAFALTTVDQPEYVKTVEQLKQYWEAIGIRVELKIIADTDIQTTIIKPRAYEALLFGEIVGSDPDPYPFWHSSQSADPGLNLAVFYNKQVDQLLEEARQTNDAEARRLKYLHFQNILAEQLPAIFLYNPQYTYTMNKKVKGIEEVFITAPSDRFLTIADWYIKTDRKWK